MLINNDRNQYIDILKGSLMILVVLGHINILDYNARSIILIYSFHMPAFLLIGGFLSNINESSNIKNIMCKRFMSCIIPYFIFNIVGLIFFGSMYPIKESIINTLLGIGNPEYAVNLPTWFLTFYFTTMVIYEIVKYISIKISKNSIEKHIKILFIIIICTIIGFLTHRFFRKVMWPPYNIQQSLFCIIFVYIGDSIKENLTKIKNYFNKIFIDKNKSLIISSTIIYILLIIIWYILSIKNGRIDINARDYKNKLLFYTNAILGNLIFSILIYIIYKFKFFNNILSKLGKESLYILGYHIIAFSIIYGFNNKYLPQKTIEIINNNKYYYALYFTILEITLSLLIGKIHKHIKNFMKNIEIIK